MKKIDLNYNKTLKLTNALVAEIGENDFNNLNLVVEKMENYIKGNKNVINVTFFCPWGSPGTIFIVSDA